MSLVRTKPGILSRDMIFDRCNMNDLATCYIQSSCSYYSLVSSVSCAASGPESISYHRCFGRIQVVLQKFRITTDILAIGLLPVSFSSCNNVITAVSSSNLSANVLSCQTLR